MASDVVYLQIRHSSGRGGKQAWGGQGVGGRGGRAQGQTFIVPPPPAQPVAVPGGSRVRMRRGAAEEADRTLAESFNRGEIVEQQKKSKKKKQHQQQMQLKKAAKKKKPSRKKKKKVMRWKTFKKELVYVKDVAAFLEIVREERGIPVDEAIVRLAIDGGQGLLKIVANLFSR